MRVRIAGTAIRIMGGRIVCVFQKRRMRCRKPDLGCGLAPGGFLSDARAVGAGFTPQPRFSFGTA